MHLARIPVRSALHRRSGRLAALLATAVAVGLAAALLSAGGQGPALRHAGAGAPDVLGPAAQSGWG